MIGKTLGKYRILAAIGRGGMGTVYKAVDETIGREVAIKVLTPEMLHGDALTQFEADARTLAALNHPQIAALHEIYRAPKDVLMVMELVRGETLDQMLAQSGPVPVHKAASLVVQILSALSHAHAAGVVHRDLKPSNVMVTDRGNVKLLDFGTSRISSAALMTAVGPTFGASAYMAPERILGNEVDSRADLYSVAVLFYRLVTGTLPFAAAAVPDLIQKQLTGAPLSARSQREDVPDWCEQLLTRALAKSPEVRFQTAEEFKAALLSGVGPLDERTGMFEAPAPVPEPPPTLMVPVTADRDESALPPVTASMSMGVSTAPHQPGAGPARAMAPNAAAVDPLAAPVPAADGLAPTLVAASIPFADPLAPAPTMPSSRVASSLDVPAVDPLGPTLAAPLPAPEALAPTLAAPFVALPGSSASTLPASGGASPSKVPAVDPLAPTLAAPIPEAISLPPTLTMPLDGPLSAALAPTLAAPTPAPVGYGAPAGYPVSAGYTDAAWAPTAATPVGALAPTELAPAPVVPSGPTLVMARKQFAVAGLLLTTLALAVVILAVIVLRRPAEIVMAPGGSTAAESPAAGAPGTTAPVPEVPSVSVPPTAIVDPPILPTGTSPPPDPPLVSASGRTGSPPVSSAAAPVERAAGTTSGVSMAARPTNTLPFVFDARAVVSEGDKHREREASVLVADGTLKVSQKDGQPLYVLALPDITGLTYSSSKQPLWNSPTGPAEAMRVDGGAFGFLKGGRNNWFGIRTNNSLLVLRVDDSMVARVITGLQDRIGLPVARLIEPKE